MENQGYVSEKWDIRFLLLAEHVSTWSKDPSTQCGTVIVRPNKTIASIGFNGFPIGISDNEEYLNNREEKYKRIIHSEVNAIIFSQENLNGFTLYNFPFICCDRCAVQVIQSGIKRVIAVQCPDDQYSRWGESIDLAKGLFIEAGVVFKEVEMEKLS